MKIEMGRQDYIDRIDDLTVEQIAEGISKGAVTFDELKKTGEFDASKQRKVRELLNKNDDEVFLGANTVTKLKDYLRLFPNGRHVSEVQEKIQRMLEIEKILEEVKNNINEYTPNEITEKLSDDVLKTLCDEIGIDSAVIKNYRSPTLNFNHIPQDKNEVPIGYTDVFFWGIPSSGKTCALAAIFSTINKEYVMEAPDNERQFGATYRNSLVNMFLKDTGYLPESGTVKDKTQYMPFLLYKRDEKHKRKISFFELSGEVFKYFYEVANQSEIVKQYDRGAIEGSFKTLDLLLNSSNQKIHFFFIDYNQETKHTVDSNGLTQSNYLDAATTYFKNRNNIFKEKTDAVYVVITKSDEIKGDAKIKAKEFLDENFGAFMAVLKNQSEGFNVDFKVKLFSIGDVYFKRICKINRTYSRDIIEDLLAKVKPARNCKFINFFNS